MRRVGVGIVVVALAAGVTAWWLSGSGDSARAGDGEEPRRSNDTGPRVRWSQPGAAANLGDTALSGRIVDADGNPLADIEVVATAPPDEGPESLEKKACGCTDGCDNTLSRCPCRAATEALLRRFEERTQEPEPMARMVTQSDGRFALSGLPSGKTFTLWAEHPRLGALVKDGVGHGELGDVVLPKGTTVKATVVDALQQPIEGARLRAIAPVHQRMFEATSDADGKLQLGPFAAPHLLAVLTREGFLPSHLAFGDSGGEVKLVLQRPRVLEGVVLRRGVPAGGVEVSLAGNVHERLKQSTRSDGTFRFENLDDGTWEIRAESQGELAEDLLLLDGLELTAHVELLLAAPSRLSGVVLDDKDRPVENAEITLFPYEGLTQQKRTSDGRGRFFFDRLSPGEYGVGVTNSELLSAHEDEEPVSVEVKGGSETELQLHVHRGLELQTRVVDPDGAPLDEGDVSVSLADGGWASTSAPQKDGGVTTWFVRDPGPWLLVATAPGFSPGSQLSPAPARDVAVAVQRGGTFEGTVFDSKGTPVAQAQVSALRDVDMKESEALRYEGRPSVTADEKGHYEMKGLSAGRWVLQAVKPGSSEVNKAVASAESDGRGKTRVDLKAPPTEFLVGIVTDELGAPVEKVRVYVVPPHKRPKRTGDMVKNPTAVSAISEADGRFRLEPLVAGKYTLEVWSELHQRPDPKPVSVPGPPLTVKLTALKKLSGRVVDSKGAPVLQFELNGELKKTSDGRFSVPVGQHGQTVSLTFHAAGLGTALKEVSADATEIGDVVLGGVRQVVLTVLDAQSGAPVDGAELLLAAANVAGNRSLRHENEPQRKTGPDGKATVEVSAGDALIFLRHPKFLGEQVTVKAGESQRTVTLQRNATLRGRVVDATGAGIDDVSVSATVADGGLSMTDYAGSSGTEDGGFFQIELMTVGTLQVRAQDLNGGRRFAPLTVTVSGGADTRVELRELAGGTRVRFIATTPEGDPAWVQASLLPANVTVPSTRPELAAASTLVFQAVRANEGFEWVISNVPEGDYTLVVWPGRVARQNLSRTPVRVSGEKELTVKLTVDPDE